MDAIDRLYSHHAPLFSGSGPLATERWVERLWAYARGYQTSAVSLTRVAASPQPVRTLEAHLFHQQPEVLVELWHVLAEAEREELAGAAPELAEALDAASPVEPDLTQALAALEREGFGRLPAEPAIVSLARLARSWSGTGRELLDTAVEDWQPRVLSLGPEARAVAARIVRKVATSRKLKERVNALSEAWERGEPV